MSSIPLPPGLRVNGFSMAPAAVTRAHSSPFGGDGAEAVVDLLQDRWRASFSTTATTRAESGAVEAWLAAQRGGANTTPLWHMARPYPLGTLGRQHAVYGLLADAAQGADEIQLATAPGATLLAGDMVGVSGLLLQCAADCVADGQGVITVPLVNRLRRALTGLRRASTATFVDGGGVLQTAAANVARFQGGQLLVEGSTSNLATWSEQFDQSSWTKNNTTVTANATNDPFGLPSADLLSEGTAPSVAHGVFGGSFIPVVAGLRYTASFYVKAAERHRGRLVSYTGTADVITVFDLSAGVITDSINGALESRIDALANGWFRVSHGFIAGATGVSDYRCQWYLLDNSGAFVYSGTGPAGVYLFGAQVEQGSLSSYIPTTTAPATRAADVIAPAIWNKPTRPFRLASRAGVRHAAGYAEGLALDFLEDLAP